MRILSCFRAILELKTPFLIGVSNVSYERPFCNKISVKKFKRSQNLLFGNPTIICKIYFCKLLQATTLCGIYFLQYGKIRQKKSAKTNTALILAKINFLKVVVQVIQSRDPVRNLKYKE